MPHVSIQPDLRVYAYSSAVMIGRGDEIWSRFIAPGAGMSERRRVIQAMVHEPEDFRFNTLVEGRGLGGGVLWLVDVQSSRVFRARIDFATFFLDVSNIINNYNLYCFRHDTR